MGKRRMKSEVLDMQYDFWSRKVDHHIQMFEYGRDTQEQFIRNMMLMGFEEEDLENLCDSSLPL
jgi:hypothetical protein